MAFPHVCKASSGFDPSPPSLRCKVRLAYTLSFLRHRFRPRVSVSHYFLPWCCLASSFLRARRFFSSGYPAGISGCGHFPRRLHSACLWETPVHNLPFLGPHKSPLEGRCSKTSGFGSVRLRVIRGMVGAAVPFKFPPLSPTLPSSVSGPFSRVFWLKKHGLGFPHPFPFGALFTTGCLPLVEKKTRKGLPCRFSPFTSIRSQWKTKTPRRPYAQFPPFVP